jgi:hypothetical protein
VSPAIIAAGTKTRNNKSVLHVMIAGPPGTHRSN